MLRYWSPVAILEKSPVVTVALTNERLPLMPRAMAAVRLCIIPPPVMAPPNADAQKIRNDTNRQVSIKKANAMKDAEKIKAEGEAGYMKTLSEAYNTEEKAEFYDFIRGIDALKNSLSGNKNNTVILDKDSELVRILYGMY